MWEEIWTDFTERARRLVLPDAVPRDAVDITVLWQLRGYTCHVPEPLKPEHLHLPELYSGSPWNSARPWIAFVTINPSIGTDELFPGICHFNDHRNRNDIAGLVRYFDERFDLDCRTDPLPHGRFEGRLKVWKGSLEQPTYHRQATWEEIEKALRRCLDLKGVEPPLGAIAAIVDAVPWKFAKWSCVLPEWQRDLLKLGNPYLSRTLQSRRPPAAVIACGLGAKLLPKGHMLLSARDGQLPINGRNIPFFEMSAPTAHGGAFMKQMIQSAGKLNAALEAGSTK